MKPAEGAAGTETAIVTPDRRLRVYISVSLPEMAVESEAARSAVETMRLHAVLVESGARAHSPEEIGRSYLEQSDIFVGIYGQGATAEQSSVIESEYSLSETLPRLVYVKESGLDADSPLAVLLDRIRNDGTVTYRSFRDPEELAANLANDLAVLMTERFGSNASTRDLPSGTLTFLVVDLEDSTPLLHRLGDDYTTLQSEYHAIVHHATGEHGGQVVSTEGDGLMSVFMTPTDAARTAIEIQARLSTHTWPQAVAVRGRVGIHTGTANRTPGGYVGLDVHRAAQVGGAAHGGQILISATAGSLIEDHAAIEGWNLVDLGAFTLGQLTRSVHLYRLDGPDLPPVVLPPRARSTLSFSVPLPVHQIIGRRADSNGAAELLLRDSVRLVTITGPGGTGKTRLAIELARRLEPEFPDGVVFVDLSALRDPDQFLATVGRALGVHEAVGRSVVEGLGRVLGPAKMLLILDNMEQVIAAGSEIGQILEVLPNIRVLVTSRSPLRLSFEQEYPLSPLPVPDASASTQSVAESDAVALFVERAGAVRPGFSLDPGNASVVAEITRRLDGLPLAIELAAARLRIFTPEVLLQRLDDRLALLDRGPLDAPERHRTLRGAIQWSHDLLDDRERVVFRRLAVFAGGWQLESALAVCVDQGEREIEAIDLIESLVAKSLVVFSIDEEGQPRYRLLETLREFALDKLEESGEVFEIRHRHLRWCLSLAARLEDVLPSPEFPVILDELDRERFNLREGLRWSIETGSFVEDALWACGLLPLYWDTRGYVTEGLELSSRLLASAPEEVSRGRALALGTVGWLGMLAGDPDRSEEALLASDAMWRRLGDTRWLARSLAMHGMTTYNRNEIDQAEAQFDEAVILARENGIEWLADAWCTYGLAHIALARNDFASADRLLRQTLDYSRQLGLTWGVGHAQLSLGVLAFMLGDLPQSVERLSESLLVRQKLKDARGICDCLAMMALLASVQGEHALAAVLLGAAEVRREATGHTAVPWQQPMLEQAMVSARHALGEEDFESGLDEGRSLSTDQAIELAARSLSSVTAGAAI